MKKAMIEQLRAYHGFKTDNEMTTVSVCKLLFDSNHLITKIVF